MFVQVSVDGFVRRLALRRRTEGGHGVDEGLRREPPSLHVRVSDYQEPKNMENVPKILPNTARLHAAFRVR